MADSILRLLNSVENIPQNSVYGLLQLPEEKIAEIAKNQNKEKILKDIGNLSSGENIASRIDDIIDGSGKTPYDIMNDAGYKNKNVLHNEEYIKTINQILEKEDANKLISQIKEQKECTNKPLGDMLNPEGYSVYTAKRKLKKNVTLVLRMMKNMLAVRMVFMKPRSNLF